MIGASGGKAGSTILVLQEIMAGEARKARKAERSQHAVDVHVLDPLVYVPGGLAHLVEGSRFHAIFVARPAGNGVHPDHRHEAVLEYPAIARDRKSTRLNSSH